MGRTPSTPTSESADSIVPPKTSHGPVEHGLPRSPQMRPSQNTPVRPAVSVKPRRSSLLLRPRSTVGAQRLAIHRRGAVGEPGAVEVPGEIAEGAVGDDLATGRDGDLRRCGGDGGAGGGREDDERNR